MVNLINENSFVYSFMCNDYKIELATVDINKLIPHEEVDFNKIKTIAKGIKEIGYIKHTIPCIEYDDNFIVLDGHHRLESLKMLGYKRAPIQIVQPESIILDYWYHVISNPKWTPLLSEDSHSSVEVTFAEYQLKDSGLITKINYDQTKDIFSSIQNIYHTYGVDQFYRQSTMPQDKTWVQYNGITLDMIIKSALKGKLMPPGLSRFKIPYKVLNLEVPLLLLKKGTKVDWEKFYEKIYGSQVCELPVICVN